MQIQIQTSQQGQLSNPQLKRLLNKIVKKAAHDVEAHAKASILSGEKTGQMYGTHQASAPGQAPANDTGVLANSIKVTSTGDLQAVIGSNVEYAPYLELGTTQIAARPFLGPALTEVKKPFTSAVEKALS